MGSRGETRKGQVDTLAQGARDGSSHAPPPTRRTLTFPRSEVLRRSASRVEPDSLFTKEAAPTALLRALGAYESSGELDERDGVVPPSRPSERSTVPTLITKGVFSDSSARMIELSASELESEREIAALAAPPLPRIRFVPEEAPKAAKAISEPPPNLVPGRAAWQRKALGLVVSHGVLALGVGLVVGAGAHLVDKPIVREPNLVLSERTPLASPASVVMPPPPSGGCATSGGARVLASRAQLGPGLDVSVLETGFGVALAAGKSEAVGLRVEGSGLRVAETVRVKTASLVRHAVVEAGHEEDNESLDVRIDSDEARTIVGSEGPPFRIVARGGSILALLDDLHGVRIRNLWPVPGARFTSPPAPVASVKSSPYRPPGFSKLPAADTRPSGRAPVYAPESVRAVGRDDGGAVVVLRRPSTFYLGVTDAALDPAGPLVVLSRNGATVGTPALASWGGGGVVAWAERPVGEREWTVMVAGFTPDGEGATTLGPVRAIGKGMSPTLASLPDGDVLLAHADGPSGGHRVVAVRLGRDLEPRGEPLVVSPETVNAGQPALAVRPDGRALVAFFAAERGRPGASVFATPLACDPGL